MGVTVHGERGRRSRHGTAGILHTLMWLKRARGLHVMRGRARGRSFLRGRLAGRGRSRRTGRARAVRAGIALFPAATSGAATNFATRRATPVRFLGDLHRSFFVKLLQAVLAKLFSAVLVLLVEIAGAVRKGHKVPSAFALVTTRSTFTLLFDLLAVGADDDSASS